MKGAGQPVVRKDLHSCPPAVVCIHATGEPSAAAPELPDKQHITSNQGMMEQQQSAL